jgi:hypothetical protein
MAEERFGWPLASPVCSLRPVKMARLNEHIEWAAKHDVAVLVVSGRQFLGCLSWFEEANLKAARSIARGIPICVSASWAVACRAVAAHLL